MRAANGTDREVSVRGLTRERNVREAFQLEFRQPVGFSGMIGRCYGIWRRGQARYGRTSWKDPYTRPYLWKR